MVKWTWLVRRKIEDGDLVVARDLGPFRVLGLDVYISVLKSVLQHISEKVNSTAILILHRST
jgi:hypothetical protein